MNTQKKIASITGHGIDIVALSRFYSMPIARSARLAKYILTDNELNIYVKLNNLEQPLYLAKIWASKEAILKAFGTGICGRTVWKNICISNNKLGKPEVWLKTSAMNCLLSISYETDYLIASAILTTSHTI